MGRTTAKKCITAYNYIFFYCFVWEVISKTSASGFIRGCKHLETIKALCVRCLEPLMKSSHLFLIYYFLLPLWPEVNFFLSALHALLMRFRREPSVSIKNIYIPLYPGYIWTSKWPRHIYWWNVYSPICNLLRYFCWKHISVAELVTVIRINVSLFFLGQMAIKAGSITENIKSRFC